jgi:hypothetical protein
MTMLWKLRRSASEAVIASDTSVCLGATVGTTFYAVELALGAPLMGESSLLTGLYGFMAAPLALALAVGSTLVHARSR